MRVLVVILTSLVLAFCHGLRPGLLRLRKLIRQGLRPSQFSAYLYVINYRTATEHRPRLRLVYTSFRPYALRHGFLLAPAPKTAPKCYGATFLPASILHNALGIMPRPGRIKFAVRPGHSIIRIM